MTNQLRLLIAAGVLDALVYIALAYTTYHYFTCSAV